MPIKDDSVVKWTTVNGEKVPEIVLISAPDFLKLETVPDKILFRPTNSATN